MKGRQSLNDSDLNNVYQTLVMSPVELKSVKRAVTSVDDVSRDKQLHTQQAARRSLISPGNEQCVM